MINNPKETTEFPPREEGNSSDQIGKASTTSKASSSSTLANPTPWLSLKDPRIVRVSRVFGGKDRHSKVCTIRGLRDRRVRLSVPTAIQLYDLQERLGLNQPSKVVDWLLNAAKEEIDELPPLPMPLAGNFSLLTSSSREANAAAATTTTNASQNEDEGVVPKHNVNNDMSGIQWELGSSSRLPARPNFWTNSTTTTTTTTSTAHIPSDAHWRERSKEVVARETANKERENWRCCTTRNEVIDQKGGNELGSNINLPQRSNNHPFFTNMLNSIAHMPHGTANYRWEPPPNYPLLSQSGGSSQGLSMITSQTDHDHQHHQQHLQSLNFMSLQSSTLSLSTGSSPFLVCPPGNTSTSTTTQTYFPSQASSMEIVDPRQGNHFQMLMSLPNQMRSPPFHFGTNNSKLVGYYSLNDNIIESGHQQNKERD